MTDLAQERRDPPAWTPERAARAVIYEREGMSDDEIAARLEADYPMHVTGHGVRLKLDAMETARQTARQRTRR